MEDNYIASIVLQCLCFAFWISISVYFYRQDTKERHEQKLDAILRETAGRGTRSAFTGFFQVIFRCSIWYSVFEAVSVFPNIGDNALSFHPSTKTAVNIISINVVFMDTLYLITFGTLCILYTASFVHSLGAHRFASQRINGHFDRLQPVLFEVLLIPSLSTFLSVLHCDADGQTVGGLESVQWLDAGHSVLLPLGVVMVAAISFYALRLNQEQALSAESDSESGSASKPRFVFMRRFIVQWQSWQIAMAGIKTFFVEQVVVVLALMAAMSIYMEWLVLRHQPCLGTASIFNAHFAAALAVILWATSVSAVMVAVGDAGFLGLSELLLAVGVAPTAFSAWFWSQKRQSQLDGELLSECECIFDETQSVNDRVRTAKRALILSMSTQSASEMMDLFFGEKRQPTLLRILGSTTKEGLSTVLCQCLTNLAVISGPFRRRMFCCPKLLRVLLRHVASKRSSLVQRAFPRSLLGLLNNLSIDFAEFSPFITSKVLLDITSCLEDDRLRSISAQLILSLVAARGLDKGGDAAAKQREIRQWMLSTPMMFKRIWFIVEQSHDGPLRQKGLEIVHQAIDCKASAEALFRCKPFDLDRVREIDTVTSRTLCRRIKRLHFVPTKTIKLKSSAFPQNGNEAERRRRGITCILTAIQRMKRALRKWSDRIAVTNDVSSRRPSKHAVFIEEVS